jgi:hypothetical protein
MINVNQLYSLRPKKKKTKIQLTVLQATNIFKTN